jgi:acyl-CoA synthetase (AMP-forming)/AMP-acid ligase II
MTQPATLPEMLERRAFEPAHPFLTLLDPSGSAQDLGNHQLWARALGRAEGLRRKGLAPGDRLVLLLPNGLPFVETLFGALLAGVVPVIYPPPHTARSLPRYLAQLGRILEQCRPWGAVLDEAALEAAGSLAIEGLRLVAPPFSPEPLAEPHRPDPDAPALVQYSSGSTGDPKGAVLSHRAILANGRAIGQAIASVPSDVMLSWLPLCHDMGLFGGLLFAWLHGWRAVHLQPHHFLAEPAVWLRAIGRYRATITIAPNFAYSLCLHGIEEAELEGVDLSSLRVAFNGAEPIGRLPVEGFIERFRPLGFRPEALFPVYGMAENTLAVAFPPLSRGPRFDRVRRLVLELEGRAVRVPGEAAAREEAAAQRPPAEPRARNAPGGAQGAWLAAAGAAEPESGVKEIASVGRPIEGVELRVVDDKDEPVAERVEGQICIRGSSLMSEYLNNPSATASALRGGWLHTGDRGYIAGGELHVTGRLDDLIIRAGRNLHPQDLEAAVDPLEGVRRGCVVAAGVRDPDDGTEQVVLLVETKLQASDARALEALRHRIHNALLDALGLVPEHVVLLAPRALPKTSSGKLQRRLALELLRAGELPQLEAPR